MFVAMTPILENNLNILKSIDGVSEIEVSETTDIIEAQINNVDSLTIKLISSQGNFVKFIIPKCFILDTLHENKKEPFMDIITQRLKFLDDNKNPHWSELEPYYYINRTTHLLELVRDIENIDEPEEELQKLITEIETIPDVTNIKTNNILTQEDKILFTFEVLNSEFLGTINFSVLKSIYTDETQHQNIINNVIELINQNKTMNITANIA
jgi:hypothetical protein